ncbi:outer membrane lipoprotein-sorting protein [Burkholderia pseudomallei]|uniref:outer membrane lipoprotein-sorting protein n=1 Tax=Burkholderia pseudomallei TaxID=28450 RepID=UPI004063CF39
MSRLKYTLVLTAALIVVQMASASEVATSQPSATEIVAASDRARGGNLNGVEWSLDISGQDGGNALASHTYDVRASGDSSLAEATYPPRDIGSRLLQVGRSMWFGKPTLTKPVSISARQKMIGLASYGDIASTNYAKDYDATVLRTEQINGEDVYVLNLTAKNRFVTYDRIVYYVSVARLVPLKAEFYTVSGKILKNAVFEMGNKLSINGKIQPFVSKMTIEDAIEKSNYSVLQYRDVQSKSFNSGAFSVDALNRP